MQLEMRYPERAFSKSALAVTASRRSLPFRTTPPPRLPLSPFATNAHEGCGLEPGNAAPRRPALGLTPRNGRRRYESATRLMTITPNKIGNYSSSHGSAANRFLDKIAALRYT
jgi:hypothetical protein